MQFQMQSGLQPGNLVRFAISDGGLVLADGKVVSADLEYLGKVNRTRAFADSYSKVCASIFFLSFFISNMIFFHLKHSQFDLTSD